MAEIKREFDRFRIGEKPITGETIIARDLAIDSLAMMDSVMELEDRYDISVPMSIVAEIHTVDQLADAIIDLSKQP